MRQTPKIQTREQLFAYIKRNLGGGFNQIELEDDNIDDIITDCIDYFCKRAFAGKQEFILPLELKKGVQSYTLPYVYSSILSVNANSTSGIQNSIDSASVGLNFLPTDILMKGGFELSSYEMAMQKLRMIEIYFGKSLDYNFNTTTKELFFITSITTDLKCITHGYKYIGTQTGTNTDIDVSNIYDHIWVKRYCVEQARRLWAINLMKYDNVTLPNGGTINWQNIKDLALEEIEKLKQELEEQYVYPVPVLIGRRR